jgi:carboxyl-terminal processing protease
MNRRLQVAVVAFSTAMVALLLFGAVHGRTSAADNNPYTQLGVYSEVLSRIKGDYVEEPDIKAVTLGAINGMLEALDPFASYLNADQYKQYLASKDQKKADVGLVLSKKFGYIGIVDSIPGSPAAKAGLTTTDVIETINGVATRDMPLAFAELLLKGDAGTTVEVGVLRYRNPEPTKLTIARAPIHYPVVLSKMLPDQIGLVQAQSLEGNNVQDLAAKVQDLQKQGAKRLVLDLRHCSTGSPESGIALANLFLDKGLITYTQGQKIPREDFNANPAKDITHLPLAVMTNRGTADGCEIAAAALLDDKRAEVVGDRTYGDAAIRKPIKMDDGSAVILSVAKYYSPNGKAIQDTGVTPSVPVLETEQAPEGDDQDNPNAEPPQPKTGEDQTLKKAIEVVTKGKTDTAQSAPSQRKADRPA